MVDLSIITLKVLGVEKLQSGKEISDIIIIIEKIVTSKRYKITWLKHERLQEEGQDVDYRDSKVETNIDSPDFEKDLKKLILLYFQDEIKGGKDNHES